MSTSVALRPMQHTESFRKYPKRFCASAMFSLALFRSPSSMVSGVFFQYLALLSSRPIRVYWRCTVYSVAKCICGRSSFSESSRRTFAFANMSTSLQPTIVCTMLVWANNRFAWWRWYKRSVPDGKGYSGASNPAYSSRLHILLYLYVERTSFSGTCFAKRLEQQLHVG